MQSTRPAEREARPRWGSAPHHGRRGLRGLAVALIAAVGGVILAPAAAHALGPRRTSAHPGSLRARTTSPAAVATTAPPTVAAALVATPGVATPGVPAPAVTTTAVAAPVVGPYPVGHRVVTLTDTTRASPARGDVAGSAGRTLRTLITAPLGAGGPLPVIVFAHGFDSEPESYAVLLDTWAMAGYLVLAPESPGAARDLPGWPTRDDIAGQAQDLSFLVGVALGQTLGAVDPGRLAVAGHSDGGSAVAALALDGALRDPRIAAYLVLSGAIPSGVAGTWGRAPESGSLLVVVGDQDEYGNLGASTAVYAAASMTKTLAVAPGGDHLGTYVAGTALAGAVRAETVAFLDAALGPSAVTPAGSGETSALDLVSAPAA